MNWYNYVGLVLGLPIGVLFVWAMNRSVRPYEKLNLTKQGDAAVATFFAVAIWAFCVVVWPLFFVAALFYLAAFTISHIARKHEARKAAVK